MQIALSFMFVVLFIVVLWLSLLTVYVKGSMQDMQRDIKRTRKDVDRNNDTHANAIWALELGQNQIRKHFNLPRIPVHRPPPSVDNHDAQKTIKMTMELLECKMEKK